MTSSTKADFKQVFVEFCERYHAHPSLSMGQFPFALSWDIKNGWRIG